MPSLQHQKNTQICKELNQLSYFPAKTVVEYIFDESVPLDDVKGIACLKDKKVLFLLAESIVSGTLLTDRNVEKLYYLTQLSFVQNILDINLFSCDISLPVPAYHLTQTNAELESNLNAPIRNFTTIPKIIHHIWLTHPSSPREVDDNELKNVITTYHTASTQHLWRSIVWTYSRALIPKSLATLESNGVEVIEVAELNSHLKAPKEFYRAFVEKNWGIASDILRIEIINFYGGVYMDLNYKLARNLDDDIRRYDYLTHQITSEGGLSNSFFAAKAQHPILKGALAILNQSFHDTSRCITDLRNLGDVVAMTIIMSTAITLSMFINASQNGNIDVIYPPYGIYHDIGARPLTALSSNETIDTKNYVCMASKYGKQIEDRIAQSEIFEQALNNGTLCLAPNLIIGDDGESTNSWLSESE